jgi:ribosome-associated heat shock protein Hsp15
MQRDAVRLDVWLWAARWFKTRSLAKQAIGGGKVEVNEQPCKVARPVHVGDRLWITRGDERHEVEVLGLSEVRGPAAGAAGLYRETESSAAARAARREQRRLLGPQGPPSRPDKQARRELRRLKDRPG